MSPPDTPTPKVRLGGDASTGWHSAYRGEDGRLVVEWLEYSDPAPYDHATKLVFDADQEAALRAALGADRTSPDTLSALASRFQTYWAVRKFADAAAVAYKHEIDFSP